jgi:hypothetical protein
MKTEETRDSRQRIVDRRQQSIENIYQTSVNRKTEGGWAVQGAVAGDDFGGVPVCVDNAGIRVHLQYLLQE